MDASLQHRPFRAATGVGDYDAVSFSQPPRCEAVSPIPGVPVTLVRHLGTAGEGVACASLSGAAIAGDVLLISTRASGVLRAEIDGEALQGRLSTGDGLVIPDGADSRIEFQASNQSLRLCFGRGELRRLTQGAAARSITPQLIAGDARLANLAAILERELTAPGFASHLLLDGVIRAMAVLLVRAAREPPPPTRIHLTQARLKRVIEFVHAHLAEDIGLDALAAAADLSPFHFSRVFKLTTGQAPYHYVRSRRIERARMLLEGTHTPLAEIALACGFANQSHFTAAFTQATGLSPGRHRRRFCGARGTEVAEAD